MSGNVLQCRRKGKRIFDCNFSVSTTFVKLKNDGTHSKKHNEVRQKKVQTFDHGQGCWWCSLHILTFPNRRASTTPQDSVVGKDDRVKAASVKRLSHWRCGMRLRGWFKSVAYAIYQIFLIFINGKLKLLQIRSWVGKSSYCSSKHNIEQSTSAIVWCSTYTPMPTETSSRSERSCLQLIATCPDVS